MSPLPYRTVNTFKKTSFRPKRYVRRVLRYSLRIFQSKISSLPPLGPSHLQLSPHCTLAALTSPWLSGSAKSIPTPELCTSCSPCLEHSRGQCDTSITFLRFPLKYHLLRDPPGRLYDKKRIPLALFPPDTSDICLISVSLHTSSRYKARVCFVCGRDFSTQKRS